MLIKLNYSQNHYFIIYNIKDTDEKRKKNIYMYKHEKYIIYSNIQKKRKHIYVNKYMF